MTDVKLTKETCTFDIELDDTNSPRLATEEEELEQRCGFKLEFFINDWFLDLGFGVPYYGEVFRRGVSTGDLYSIFEEAVAEEEGVQRVLETRVQLESRTRTARIQLRALADSGEELNFELDGSI